LSDTGNIENILENVNENFDHDLKMKILKEELDKRFSNYRKSLAFMSADAPIETLCLPKSTQDILTRNGCLRIYDLIGLDFTKIKGLGVVRIRDLTASLDQFISMF